MNLISKSIGLTASAILIALCCNAQGSNTATVKFKATDDAIVNPGKGWVLYGSPASQPAEAMKVASTGYTRFTWGEIEPQEGVYNWELIDKNIKAWADAGKKFAFGVMGASTHSKTFWASPKWVFDAGAKYSTFKLEDPKLATTGIPGDKLVPVFDDTIYIAKMKQFIKALADRYDGNPNIDFIDIRSYGNWGEGHMYPFGKPDISAEKYKEHIKIHRDAFKKTLLQLTTGKHNDSYFAVYDWAVSQGVGLRRDGICGNSNGDEVTQCDGKMAAVFEFYGNYEMMEQLGWWYGKKDNQGRGFKLVDCIETGKPSYCDLSRGRQSALNFLNAEPELVKKVNNRLGYHFLLTEVKYPASIVSGKSNSIGLSWENRGVTQIYIPAKVTFALLDKNGKVAAMCDATESIPADWKSDKQITVNDKFTLKGVSSGEYTLAVGIRQPRDTSTPSIKLGIDQKPVDGWYSIGKIAVK